MADDPGFVFWEFPLPQKSDWQEQCISILETGLRVHAAATNTATMMVGETVAASAEYAEWHGTERPVLGKS